MANNCTENVLGIVDKRDAVAAGVTAPTLNARAANYDDVASLRTRLTAIDSTTYSSARLDAMTKNDMVYAVRLNDDLAGL